MAPSHLLLGAGAAVAYAAFWTWRLRLLKTCIRQSRACGPAWLQRLGWLFMKTCARLNGVRLVSEGGEGLDADASKRYLYVWHPHGFVSYVPAHIMGEHAVSGKPHGRRWFGTCIPLLFKIPGMGEIFQLTNARPVDKKSLESILSQGGTVAIQPGGVKEQEATRHDQEQAFFPARLGFIRMAIKYGTPLMPLYVFGENQLYKRVDGFEWLTKLIHKFTGMTLPICTAKFGLPQAGILPRATDIHIRWGLPVEVGEPDESPSEEHVEAVFKKYLAELQRLFDKHAKECLPPAVAAKGLRVERIQAKPEAAKEK